MVDWDWVETIGPSVDRAVEAGLAELGLEDPELAEIEVLQEPARGFLGMGGKDAVVRIRRKPQKKKKRRRRNRGQASRRSGSEQGDGGRKRQSGGDKRRSDDDRRERQRDDKPSRQQPRREQGAQKRAPRQRTERKAETPRPEREKQEEPTVTVDINEQATVVDEFLRGLVEAFGFDGTVVTRVEDDVIYADVTGTETEALVGERGAVMQSILELCRTVVQRKTQEGARIRIDIAGYGERRREALKIYAGRLAEQVLEDGGEIMLEPMNPAERKVVHDAIAEIDGVGTYSEGQEPQRSVVIHPD